MSHRKYYKEGLNLSAVQTLVRPHALYSGNAVGPMATGGTGQASSGRAQAQKAVAEDGAAAALGGLLLLEPSLGGSGQHPPPQGHGVRGRDFRGQKALCSCVLFRAFV